MEVGGTDFLSMLKKAFSFEPSSGVLSTAALGLDKVGVAVPERSADGCLDEEFDAMVEERDSSDARCERVYQILK